MIEPNITMSHQSTRLVQVWDKKIRLTLYNIMMHSVMGTSLKRRSCDKTNSYITNQYIQSFLFSVISLCNCLNLKKKKKSTILSFVQPPQSSFFYLICPIMQHYVTSTNVPQMIWIELHMTPSINCDITFPHTCTYQCLPSLSIKIQNFSVI